MEKNSEIIESSLQKTSSKHDEVISTQDKMQALKKFVEAATNGETSKCKELLAGYPALLKKTVNKAFLLAAKYGHTETFLWLLTTLGNPGLRLRCYDDNGNTALLLAAGGGHLEIVKNLWTDRPLCQSQMNNSCRTALLCAAKNGHHELVSWLLGKGASLNDRDKIGRSS